MVSVDRLPAGFLEAKVEALREPGAMRELFRAARLGISLQGQRLDLRALAAGLDCPLLIIWGDRDRVIPISHGRRLAQALPSASLRVFADCGHCPQLESASEFAEAVGSFAAAAGNAHRRDS